MSKRPDRAKGTPAPKVLPKKFKSELRQYARGGPSSDAAKDASFDVSSGEILAAFPTAESSQSPEDIFSSGHSSTSDLFSGLTVSTVDDTPEQVSTPSYQVQQSHRKLLPVQDAQTVIDDVPSMDLSLVSASASDIQAAQIFQDSMTNISDIGHGAGDAAHLLSSSVEIGTAHEQEQHKLSDRPISSSDVTVTPDEQHNLSDVTVIPHKTLYDAVLDACFGPMEPEGMQQADVKWGDMATSDPFEGEDCVKHREVQDETPKPKGSDLLYENAPITVEESLLSILTLTLTDNLNGKTLERVLKLISLHLPKPNLFSSSSFTFFNNLETQDSPLEMYYYCSVCYRYRVSSTDICRECEGVNKTVDYFIFFPVSLQLSKLFSRSQFVSNLKYRQNREKINNDNIEDVYDSEVYKKFEANPTHQGKHKISLGWNSDGISPYNSSLYSLSPIYLVVNELPPEERFKKENVIIAGLWGSKQKPNPNLFLRPIYDEIKKLNEEGITAKVEDDILNFIVEIIWGTCDTPAKATFLNLKSHTGFCSCPKCLTLGASVDNVVVFPHEDILQLRNDENYLEIMNYVINNRNKKDRERDLNFAGFKGSTLLHFMVTDMIKSTAIDSMHCVYLGCTRQILNLLFNVTFRNAPYSLYAKLDEVNEKLSTIRLPHFVDRDLVPVDKLSCMKASVLKNMLFYILLPLLSLYMKENYFNNLKLLVTGVALLNSNSVSREDIIIADALLCQFVADFEILYTPRNMSFNIHLLRHLAKCVTETGPLALTSCFPFESLNGDLLSLAHGTRHAGLQIATTLSNLTELPEKIVNMPSGPAKEYCEQLTSKFKRLKLNEYIGPKIFSVGKYSSDKSTEDKFVFSRLWKNGLLYVAQNYTLGSRQSSYVKYVQNDSFHFGRVKEFRKNKPCRCLTDCECPVYFTAVIQPLQCSQAFNIELTPGHLVKVPHIYEYSLQDGEQIISVSQLENVCLNVNSQFLCDPLNKYELM